MPKLWTKWIEKLQEWDARHGYNCDLCGRETFAYPAHRLCETCESLLVENKPDRICGKCGRTTRAQGICLDCKSALPAFTRGFSPFVYHSGASALVNSLKTGKRRLAYFLGEKMADCFAAAYQSFSASEREEPLLLVSVPSTESTLLARGYNQAEALLSVIAKRLTLRGVSVEIGEDILQKRKETAQQKELDFYHRAKNVSGAYHVHKRKECKGRTVLLIDDVMTTGATGNECARRLFGAGASKVYFLVSAMLPEKEKLN